MTKALKAGVIKYLQFESSKLYADLKLEQKFYGWSNILRDKCYHNELMDVTSINMPDFESNLDNQNFFIYAGFFKPGYH